MPTPYTGDETATEAPAAKPAFGVRPIINLPIDTDPPNGATWEQAYKALADYVAFLMVREIFSADLGDGATDTTINTSIPAGGNNFARNLTIGGAGLLRFETPHILRVQDTLNVASGGIVRWGHASRNGANGTPGTGGVHFGAGGTGLNSLSTGYLGGGGNGGNGGDDSGAGLAGKDGDALGTARMGGIGGAGGQGGSFEAGGVAGTSTSFLTTVGSINNVELLRMIVDAGRALVRTAGTPPTLNQVLLMGGSPGGGGGGPSSLASPPRAGGGGGGGAGGSVGIIIARRVVVAADGCFQVPGGNGGNASDAGTGGGGGGGGGWLGIICGTYSGPPLTTGACCPGGTGGTGGTGPQTGANGGLGRIDILPIGY